MNVACERETALRIGLAARALPGSSPAALLQGLAATLGWPLDDGRLSRVTVAQLEQALAGRQFALEDVKARYSVPQLRAAAELLWGGAKQEESLPTIDPDADVAAPGSILVAVASDQGELLDAHFGSCRRFLIYRVAADSCRLAAVRDAAAAQAAPDGSAARVQLIRDCQVLFVQSIGGPAAAKAVNAGIHPVKHPQPAPARERLAELQRVMAGSPPPWLAKAMGLSFTQRVRAAGGDWTSDPEE